MENSNRRSLTQGEINIRSQIMRMLAKWRIILLVGIIFAALAGAYSYKSQKDAIRAWQPPEVEEEPQSKVNSPDYTNVRDRALRALNDKTEYFSKSIALKINPGAVGRATVDMYIMTDALKAEETATANGEEGEIPEGESMPEPEAPAAEESTEEGGALVAEAMTAALRDANRILDHYCQYAGRSLEYADIAVEFDSAEQYVKELINIGAQDREVVRSTITVNFVDEEGADKILQYIIDALKAHQADVTKELGQHELIFRNRALLTIVDTGNLNSLVTTKVTEFNTLMKQYNDLKTNQNNLDVKAAVVVTEKPKMSRMKMLKTAVAGGIGGVILAAALYILLLCISSKVLSARDVNTLYGLRKLGVIPGEAAKKVRGIDKMILSPELRYATNTDPEKCYEIANGNVRSVIGEGKKVAIISDLGSEELEKLKAKLDGTAGKIEYRIAGDLSEPGAMETLKESDAVVLAARVMESRYGHMNDLMREAINMDKTLLGSIIF